MSIFHLEYNIEISFNKDNNSKFELIDQLDFYNTFLSFEPIEIEEEIKTFEGGIFENLNNHHNQFVFFYPKPKSFTSLFFGNKIPLNILYCQLKYHL